ncbi:hypothetical protein BW687_025760, partial [Pseudomonas graminis]|uniref:hypothetical protein n=1 Tax=Pseudomonas graminis TaxID=158627 RepID=UPI00234B17A5
DDELADIKLEGCIELSVFLGHDHSSMGTVSPIEVSGVIRPAQDAEPVGASLLAKAFCQPA